MPCCPIGSPYLETGIETVLTTNPIFERRREVCPFHAHDWSAAAALAITIWRSLGPANWSTTTVDEAIAHLPGDIQPAVESLIFEPLGFRSSDEPLDQGNHRLCALRYDGTSEVLIEVIV